MKDHIKKIQSGEIDVVSFTKQSLRKLENLNEEYECFSVITNDLAMECAEFVKNSDKKLPLAGVLVSIKDCIATKGVETTSSSRILKGYKPVFDATVVEKIKAAGGIIIGKTLQDEFGFGSFSTNTGLDYPTPKNPHDQERCAGGSSGGSAVITSLCERENLPHISIAESTGGSIENPASFCGVIGFCPTYGKVSRYGLLSYANSLDKIGIMASTVEETASAVNIISGKDTNDSTSMESDKIKVEKKDFKVGYIKPKDLNEEISKVFDNTLEHIKKSGSKVEEVELPFTNEFRDPGLLHHSYV